MNRENKHGYVRCMDRENKYGYVRCMDRENKYGYVRSNDTEKINTDMCAAQRTKYGCARSNGQLSAWYVNMAFTGVRGVHAEWLDWQQ